MSNLIRGEFYKLRKSKYFIGMIFLALLASFYLINCFDTDMQKLRKTHSQFVNGMASLNYGFEIIIFTSFIFSLFAAEFIAKDLKNNMSKSFIYGYERSKVILSKFIVFIICSLFLELIYIGILVTYASINYGFCEVLNYSTILYLIRVVIIGIMYNVATISIIAMIAIITKNYLCTVASPALFILSFQGTAFKAPISTIVECLCPFIIGGGAIARFAPKLHIIGGIISSIVVFTITIVISLLYVKGEDIK